MLNRLLQFRLAFAVMGLIALLAGALFETVWLAGPGVVAAAVSDLIGLLQARMRFGLPVERAFRGAAEALPALGVAAFEPFAMGLVVLVVVYALFASGLQTLATARGVAPSRHATETLRRVATCLASLAVLGLPIAAAIGFDLQGRVGVSSRMVALLAAALVLLSGTVALLDSLISVKARRV
ncbi:MAG: hypothetical protein M5U25_14045 [Planctomycetota bacterium]|nr:hypothetical protein [Planctomycetota bacterium]